MLNRLSGFSGIVGNMPLLKLGLTGYAFQSGLSFGAAASSTLSVALVANWITTVGVGFSWTGWTLILIAAGMTAGYIAALLQDTSTEEWVARSIWGQASDKWRSFKREQEALNKVLLGISVEFDYTPSLTHNLGTSSAAADSVIQYGQPNRNYYKEARLRLVIPAALKDTLQWHCEVYLHHGANRRMAVSTGTHCPPAPAEIRLEGTQQPEIMLHSPDLTVVTIQAESSTYPDASAVLRVYDDLENGQLLVDQAFWVR